MVPHSIVYTARSCCPQIATSGHSFEDFFTCLHKDNLISSHLTDVSKRVCISKSGIVYLRLKESCILAFFSWCIQDCWSASICVYLCFNHFPWNWNCPTPHGVNNEVNFNLLRWNQACLIHCIPAHCADRVQFESMFVKSQIDET